MSEGVGVAAEIQAATQIGNGGDEYLRYWGISGEEPWCGYFLAWAIDTCRVGSHAKKCVWEGYGGVGYSGAVLAWGRAVGKLVPEGEPPQTGDFYIVDGHEHVGVVRGVGDGKMDTVNGNWGGEVKEQVWQHVGGSVWSDGKNHNVQFVRW
jgi:hypothetical protein